MRDKETIRANRLSGENVQRSEMFYLVRIDFLVRCHFRFHIIGPIPVVILYSLETETLSFC
jgi:hypothetical protein